MPVCGFSLALRSIMVRSSSYTDPDNIVWINPLKVILNKKKYFFYYLLSVRYLYFTLADVLIYMLFLYYLKFFGKFTTGLNIHDNTTHLF